MPATPHHQHDPEGDQPPQAGPPRTSPENNMQIFLLIQDPEGKKTRVRGVFTTAEKAKNHDVELKGGWSTGPSMGWHDINRGSLTGAHHIVRPAHANEELELYAHSDAEDV